MYFHVSRVFPLKHLIYSVISHLMWKLFPKKKRKNRYNRI